MTQDTKSLFDMIANKSVTVNTAVGVLNNRYQHLTINSPEVQKLLSIIIRESGEIVEDLRSNFPTQEFLKIG